MRWALQPALRRLAVVALATMLLAACSSAPQLSDGYTVALPGDVADSRARFRDVFCAVLREHGPDLPDYLPCEQALSPVRGEPAAAGRPVDLGPSRRRLVLWMVPGIGYACVERWLRPTTAVTEHLRHFDYDMAVVEVDALSGVETNAARIRDAVMALPDEPGPPRLVLVGYSKGAPDILEAVVRYPEIRPRIAAVVSMAGAVGGSVLADDAEQWQADWMRHWPGAQCEAGDGGGVASLRATTRRAWLADNVLPADVPYYSLVTLPTPGRVSRALHPSYAKIGRTDWRNDGQVIYSDQWIPGSQLLAFVNADHWAVALPIERSHPLVASIAVDRNTYPREALLEALLRFVEEDLDGRAAH